MANDYKQYNYSATYSGGSFASQACGPTSVADLLGISPLTTAAWLTNNGYATKGQGTSWFGIAPCLSAFGGGGKMLNTGSLLGTMSGSVFDDWQRKIQAGCTGILLMGRGRNNYWTNSGHFVAIVSYDKISNQYLVYDPASAARTGWHPFSKFAGNIKICYTSEIRWNGQTAQDTDYQATLGQIEPGSSGSDVVLAQKILFSRGIYQDRLDGSFGVNTQKAVTWYQRYINDHGGKLSVDGVMGPSTWQSILGISGSVSGKNVKITLPQITLNDKGNNTLLLQEVLSADGYYLGELDKNFGPATYAALRSAQAGKGIAVDGVCGPASWRVIVFGDKTKN